MKNCKSQQECFLVIKALTVHLAMSAQFREVNMQYCDVSDCNNVQNAGWGWFSFYVMVSEYISLENVNFFAIFQLNFNILRSSMKYFLF